MMRNKYQLLLFRSQPLSREGNCWVLVTSGPLMHQHIMSSIYTSNSYLFLCRAQVLQRGKKLPEWLLLVTNGRTTIFQEVKEEPSTPHAKETGHKVHFPTHKSTWQRFWTLLFTIWVSTTPNGASTKIWSIVPLIGSGMPWESWSRPIWCDSWMKGHLRSQIHPFKDQPTMNSQLFIKLQRREEEDLLTEVLLLVRKPLVKAPYLNPQDQHLPPRSDQQRKPWQRSSLTKFQSRRTHLRSIQSESSRRRPKPPDNSPLQENRSRKSRKCLPPPKSPSRNRTSRWPTVIWTSILMKTVPSKVMHSWMVNDQKAYPETRSWEIRAYHLKLS